MKRGLILPLLMAVLLISLVSAAWPFSFTITGNAISPGTNIPNSHYCQDTDKGAKITEAGILTLGWYRDYNDKCAGDKITVTALTEDGNTETITGYKILKEGVCRTGGRANNHPYYDVIRYSSYESTDTRVKKLTGKFICVQDATVIDLNGRAQRGIARMREIEPRCEEKTIDGVRSIINEEGKTFPAEECEAGNYIRRFCDSKGEEMSTNQVTCPQGLCTLDGQGKGCVASSCNGDTDPQNKKEIAGLLYMDLVPMADSCIGENQILQYRCATSKTLEALPPEECGENSVCRNGGAGDYCQALYADSEETRRIQEELTLLKENHNILNQEFITLKRLFCESNEEYSYTIFCGGTGEKPISTEPEPEPDNAASTLFLGKTVRLRFQGIEYVISANKDRTNSRLTAFYVNGELTDDLYPGESYSLSNEVIFTHETTEWFGIRSPQTNYYVTLTEAEENEDEPTGNTIF